MQLLIELSTRDQIIHIHIQSFVLRIKAIVGDAFIEQREKSFFVFIRLLINKYMRVDRYLI